MDNTSKNIRALRKIYGESQEDLGFALGFSGKTTISNYETGNNQVEASVRKKIAEHYWITEDELVYSDFSETAGLKLKGKTVSDLIGDTPFIAPIIKSDEAMKNENFLGAVNWYRKALELWKKRVCRDNPKFEACLDKMMDGFSAAYDEGVIEGGINVLSMGMSLVFSIRLMGGRPEIMKASPGMKAKDYVKLRVLRNFDEDHNMYHEQLSDEEQELIDDMDDYAKEMLKVFKKEKRISEYGFYSALRYFCGTIKTDISYIHSMSMGLEMILSESEMGNGYARRFLRKSTKNFE